MEEWRRVELEERRRAVVAVKAREEAQGRRIVEGLVATAAAKHKAILAAAETAVEEAKMDQAVGMPAKQKG